MCPASSHADDSDDDSFIDMYAHVEQRTRTSRQRRDSDKGDSTRRASCNNAIHDNDTKHLNPNSSKVSKNAPASLPHHRNDKQPSGLLGSFLETNTAAQQPKRSSTGNRSYCSAPAVVSDRPRKDNYFEDITTGTRKKTQDSTSRRPSLKKDSELSTRVGSQRHITSSQQRAEPGSESSARVTSTTGSSRRSLTSSTVRRAESSRSVLQSSSRSSFRASTSSSGNTSSRAASTTSTYSSRYTSSSRQPTNRATLSRSESSSRKIVGDSELDAKLKEIQDEQEEQRKKSQEIKRQVNRQAFRSSRSSRSSTLKP